MTVKLPLNAGTVRAAMKAAPQRVEKVFSPRCADFETFKKSFKILFD